MGKANIEGCRTMTEIEHDQLVDIVIAKVRAQRQYLQLKQLLDTAVEKELGPIKASITAKLSADELRELFDGIKGELMLLRTDMTLINHDLIQIREQLDRIENNANRQPQESIGIAPGTPPPTFIPPEYL